MISNKWNQISTLTDLTASAVTMLRIPICSALARMSLSHSEEI